MDIGEKSPALTGSAAFDLADYETPVVGNIQIPQVRWSIEKHRVAQMLALEGKPKSKISKETGVPVPTINKWLEHGEFRDYINQLVMNEASVMNAESLRMAIKTLRAREAAAEAADDWAGFSRADSMDIISTVRKLTGEEHKEESSYLKVMEKLMEKIPDSPARKVIDVTPHENLTPQKSI